MKLQIGSYVSNIWSQTPLCGTTTLSGHYSKWTTKSAE